jgi:hypothetical protein
MGWRDRADVIRRFYALRLARSRRAEAGHEVDRRTEDGFQVPLIDRGVALIAAYHEAGETDEAFEALRRRAGDLDVASAGPGRGREASADLILVQIRTEVEQMYDAGTAERLMAAFERGFGRTGQPGSRRA